MFLFITSYLILSFIALVAWTWADTDQTIAEIEPVLGRRLLLILLVPSVFLFGLTDLFIQWVKKEIKLSVMPAEIKQFFAETKEAWDGR